MVLRFLDSSLEWSVARAIPLFSDNEETPSGTQNERTNARICAVTEDDMGHVRGKRRWWQGPLLWRSCSRHYHVFCLAHQCPPSFFLSGKWVENWSPSIARDKCIPVLADLNRLHNLDESNNAYLQLREFQLRTISNQYNINWWHALLLY